eukprot:759286-Prorocentrum_minimum.AAC.1
MCATGACGGRGLQRGVQSGGGESDAGGGVGLAAGLAAAHLLLQGREGALQQGALGGEAVHHVGGVQPHLRPRVLAGECGARAKRPLQAPSDQEDLHGGERHSLRHAHGGGVLQGDPLRLPRRQAGQRPHP